MDQSNLEESTKSLDLKMQGIAQALLAKGVIVDDWRTLQVAGELICEEGVRIKSHVVVEGRVILKAGATVGPYCYLDSTEIGANTDVRAFSVLENVVVGKNCRIGPYARLRDKTEIDSGSSIGNFVELKATRVGQGGRINHHTFLGDAFLEENVTIGAGVITCNHDGIKSVETTFGSGAYVGSGTQLVAPLSVGADAIIGAGSTITENVPDRILAIARARQQNFTSTKIN
tara:strand:- start:234 stop:923 length:690 start_codon:yes stop_codon:yes gene_type:complete